MHRTLIIIKPHAVAKGLVGRVLARFEDMDLRLGAIKSFQGTSDLWTRFYPSDDEWLTNVGGKTLTSCQSLGIDVQAELGTADAIAIGRLVKKWLVEHMSSGPSVAAIITGNEAPLKVRRLCGATLPNVADPGTIRFDYSSDSPAAANKAKRPVFNIIHASDPSELGSVEREIEIIFGTNILVSQALT